MVMAAGRMTGYSSVLVRLQKPEDFDTFNQWLSANPSLNVHTERQPDYVRRTARRTSAFFNQLTYVVGVIISLGALFGVIKLTYAAVSSRRREIATFRAMGYQSLPVAASVVVESASLALAGRQLRAQPAS